MEEARREVPEPEPEPQLDDLLFGASSPGGSESMGRGEPDGPHGTPPPQQKRRRAQPREGTEDSRRTAIFQEMRRQKVTRKSHNEQQLRQRLRSLSYDRGGQNPAKLFQQFDTNSSGSLNFAEFAAAVRKGGKVTRQWMSDVELRRLFDAVDGDGNKEITIDELTAFVWGAAAVAPSLRSPGAHSPQRQRGQKGKRAGGAGAPEDPQEELYLEFERALAVGPEPAEAAESTPARARSATPPSGGRSHRERDAALSGWEDGASEEAVLAAFERGIESGEHRQPRSAGLRALVSPPRKGLPEHLVLSPPQPRPYYDSSLPFYGQVPVAKKATSETMRRLASPLRTCPHLFEKRARDGSCDACVWLFCFGDDFPSGNAAARRAARRRRSAEPMQAAIIYRKSLKPFVCNRPAQHFGGGRAAEMARQHDSAGDRGHGSRLANRLGGEGPGLDRHA